MTDDNKQHISLVVCGHVDAGKCFLAGTKIKMFDGSSKFVENIEKGDKIMGMDSTPRTVQSTTYGKSEMFNIIPSSYGSVYTVNDEHMLLTMLYLFHHLTISHIYTGPCQM